MLKGGPNKSARGMSPNHLYTYTFNQKILLEVTKSYDSLPVYPGMQ